MTTLQEARETYIDLVARATIANPDKADYIRVLSSAWLAKMDTLDADRPCPAEAWLGWMTRAVKDPRTRDPDLVEWVDHFADGVVEMWSRP